MKHDAARELLDAVEYYELQQPHLGGEFLGEVNSAIKTIKQSPTSWPVVGGDIRRYRLNRFPYHLYHLLKDEFLVIVAVASIGGQDTGKVDCDCSAIG